MLRKRYIHQLFVVFVLSLASANALTNGLHRNEADDLPAFLFEIYHENFAALRGMYIDDKGFIYSYDLTDHWQDFPESRYYLIPESVLVPFGSLKQRFSTNSKFVDRIDSTVVARFGALIPAADSGRLQIPIGQGFDMGQYRYFAYYRVSDTRYYRRLLLYESGDMCVANSSPEARKIAKWIANIGVAKSFSLGLDVTACEPSNIPLEDQ